MKNILILIFSMVLVSCSVTRKGVNGIKKAANPVIAHRGAFKKNALPENSIASLREAIRLKCAGSEFDIRMTADDSLIIHHDPHYQKMDIEKTNYSQLVAVPLPNGEPIPTLRQYLQAGMVNNEQTRLILEIKPSTTSKVRGLKIAESVMRLVSDLKVPASMTAFISFDYDILKKVEEINSNAETQYLTGDHAPEKLKADGIDGADYHFSVFKKNEDWIEKAHKNNLVLNAWTVNAKEDMLWLIANKFQYITTDEPELLLATWASVQGSKE